MAKTINVTVNLQSGPQFQAFMQRFNQLSQQMNQLQSGFTTLSQQVAQATQSTRQLQGALQNVLSTSRQMRGHVTGITSEFGKWVTLIGGTVMMLGGGVGMFGIDKLLNKFIDRQRTALGMGTNYTDLQPYAQAGGMFPGNTEQEIAAISKGIHDPGSDVMIGLRALGVDIKGKTPEEIRDAALARLRDMGAKMGDNLMPWARAAKVTSIFGDERLRQATTPEGRAAMDRQIKFDQQLAALLKKYKLTDEDIQKLDDLKQSWTTFSSVFELRMTKIAATIAPLLTALSKWASDPGNEFTGGKGAQWYGWGGAEHGIEKLPGAEGSPWVRFADKTKEWGEQLKKYLGTPTKTFGDNMDALNKATWDLVTKLNSETQSFWGRIKQFFGFGPGGGDQQSSSTTSVPKSTGPSTSTSPSPAPPGPTANPSPTPPAAIPAGGGFPAVSSAALGKGGVGSLGGATLAPKGSSLWKSAAQSYLNPATGPGVFRPPMAPADQAAQLRALGLQHGQYKGHFDEDAVKRMQPQPAQPQFPTPNEDPWVKGRRLRTGALDTNNWQMGSTPRLVVRNDHPSVYMNVASMS